MVNENSSKTSGLTDTIMSSWNTFPEYLEAFESEQKMVNENSSHSFACETANDYM